MNMNKKICIALFCMAMLTLMGCASSIKHEKTATKDEKLSIVTTIFPPYDFAKVIGEDKVEVTMLLAPGVESHSYEPTPQDIIKISESDLFIYVGGESDAWVEGIMDSIDRKVKTLTLMDCVEAVAEEHVEGMDAGEEKANGLNDMGEMEYDEHVWTSPRNASMIVTKITDTLCELDEDNEALYRRNQNDYQIKLQDLDRAYQDMVDHAAKKELVFGDRFPFRYLVDAYGLNYYAAFPGCSSETEPSAATIAFLSNKVKEDKIPVVLYLELSNHKIADAIAESTGVRTAMLHSCHNISKDEVEDGVSYISLMEQNLEVLKGALQSWP